MATTMVVQSSSTASFSKYSTSILLVYQNNIAINNYLSLVPLVVAESIKDSFAVECTLGQATSLKTKG